MEEIRHTALAYYAHLPRDEKKKWTKIFTDADGNRDGRICVTEFVSFFNLKEEYRGVATRIFQEFDRDRGTLDFEQVISVTYLLITGRTLTCHGCGEFLKGAYFTCKQCFQTGRYDLCCNCFRAGEFNHHHPAAEFCDNYDHLLMRSNITSSSPRPMLPSYEPTRYSPSTFTTPSTFNPYSRGHKAAEVALHAMDGVETVFKGVELASGLASVGCSIM